MNIDKILYPTDFSNPSGEALALATSLARDNSATLIICHVYEPPEPAQAMVAHSSVSSTSAEEQEKNLKQILPFDPTIRYEHRMVKGTPSDGILKLAEAENVDLIVMSTHGHTGLARLVMGSVAELVVRKAPCPVLTLKQPSHTRAAATT